MPLHENTGVVVPQFHMPYRARRNPRVDVVRAGTRDWTRQQGLIGRGGWTAERFDGIDLAGLRAWAHPDASAPRLTLVACWYVWLYFIDDFWTDTVMAAGGPGERVSTRLRAQTRPLMGADWCARFAESNLRGIEEHGYERAHNPAGRVPTPLEYAAMRRRGNNGKWAAELVELAGGTPLPPVVAHSLAVRELLDCFSDIVRLHNDIVSHERETRDEGEVNNGVLVLRAATGTSAQQAADAVNDALTMRVKHFEHLSAVDVPATAAAHDLTPADRETVTRYLRGLEDYLAGYYAWHQAAPATHPSRSRCCPDRPAWAPPRPDSRRTCVPRRAAPIRRRRQRLPHPYPGP
ncbi:hypothetical protein ACFV4N_21980 [Actinosynnema sp. NPDC059797]